VAEGRVSRETDRLRRTFGTLDTSSGNPCPPFGDLDSLNLWLEQRCQELWTQTRHGSEPGTIADVWAQEVEALMPVGRPFDGFVEYTKRVSSTCLIHLDRNRYSVPASFANRPVSLRVYPNTLVVVAESQIICEHHRIIERTHNGPGAHNLRLAPLPGGDPAQTGRLA
jgi:hypothetical protein